ncbi:MAG: outer membrane beta-barrel protein [Candidatus Polarisedimenticolia bacterium]
MLAGAAMLAAVGAAGAQTPTRDAPFPELLGTRRWGPFLVVPRFTLDNIGYDDNVFLYSQADPRPKETDYILRMGPEVRAQMPIGHRLALTIHDKLAGEVFARHSSLNHADNNFDGQFDALIGPALFTVGGTWNSYRWRPSSEIVERVRENDVRVWQTARLFLSPRTDVSFTASTTRYRYNSELPYYLLVGDEWTQATIDEALDRDQKDRTAEVGWRIRPRTRLFAQYLDRDSDFRHMVGGESRNATERRRALGVEFSASSKLSGRLLAGTSKLEPKDASLGLRPFDGTVVSSELRYRPNGWTRFTATAERAPVFSVFERNLYYVDTYRGVGVDMYLGAFWGVQGGYSLRDSKYPEVSPTIHAPRDDRTKDSYVGALFRLKNGFEIGLRVGRRKRDSNLPTAVDDQRYVTTSGTYAF